MASARQNSNSNELLDNRIKEVLEAFVSGFGSGFAEEDRVEFSSAFLTSIEESGYKLGSDVRTYTLVNMNPSAIFNIMSDGPDRKQSWWDGIQWTSDRKDAIEYSRQASIKLTNALKPPKTGWSFPRAVLSTEDGESDG